MEEGKLPNLEPPPRTGRLSPAAHHLPRALAGGVVHVCHRRQSRASRHVRFPQSQSELVHAVALFLARQRAAEDPQARPLPHSVEPPHRGNAAQEPHLLANPRAAPDRLHHPARADHVSSGKIPRPDALRHVHPGSAWARREPSPCTPPAPPAPRWRAAIALPLRRDGSLVPRQHPGPGQHAPEEAAPDGTPLHPAPAQRRRPRHSPSATSATTLVLGEYTPWVTLTFSAGLGIKVTRHRAFPADRERRRRLALLHPDQHRPRRSRAPHLPSLLLRRLPGETAWARSPPSAWPRTRGRSTNTPSIPTHF